MTREADQGEVTAVALVGTDIERIVAGAEMLHEVWASLLDVAIATWLLERKLSLACLAPVLLVTSKLTGSDRHGTWLTARIVFIGATMRLAAAANSSQVAWIEKIQERLKTTSYVLDNLRSIRLVGFQRILESKIEELRRDEVQTSESYRKVLIGMLLLCKYALPSGQDGCR